MSDSEDEGEDGAKKHHPEKDEDEGNKLLSEETAEPKAAAEVVPEVSDDSDDGIDPSRGYVSKTFKITETDTILIDAVLTYIHFSKVQ